MEEAGADVAAPVLACGNFFSSRSRGDSLTNEEANGMNASRALLIASMVFAGICCLLVLLRRPEPAPAVERAADPVLYRIEERLERLEAAIERLTWRTGESGGETPDATPARAPEEEPAHVASATRDETRALRNIERRLDELRAQLAAGGYFGGTVETVFVSPQTPEEAPPELRVLLDARLVEETERLGIKVYWSILSGAQRASERDWVGIFPVGGTDHQHVRWQFTKGLPAGEASFQLPETAGLYEARYFFESGYARVPGASAPVQVPHVEPPPAADGGRTKE
jgi:hypothetical protein